MALKEVFADSEYSFLLPILTQTPRPVVLDIGAHIGTFALWLLRQCPHSRIRSVEADPQTFRILSENVTRAARGGAHWDAINGAAWHARGGKLRFSNTGPSMSHRVDKKGEIVVEGLSLSTLLDDLAGAHGAIDLMKVDIEGSEEAFLCSAPEALRRIRCLVIELHPSLCNTDAVRTVLEQTYSAIIEIQGRASSKPLLLCH